MSYKSAKSKTQLSTEVCPDANVSLLRSQSIQYDQKEKRENKLLFKESILSSSMDNKITLAFDNNDELRSSQSKEERENEAFNVRENEDLIFAYLSENFNEVKSVMVNFLIWEAYNIPYHNNKNEDRQFGDKFCMIANNSMIFENEKAWNIKDLIVLKCLNSCSGIFLLLTEEKMSNELFVLEVISKESCLNKEVKEKVHMIDRVSHLVKNNIFFVQIYAKFETKFSFCFLYEYVKHGDLTTMISRKQRRLSENQVKIFMAEIALALNFLHENGIIYRNLSFNNVLVVNSSWVKLSDLKNCVYAKKCREKCGSYWFMAPEMFLDFPYNRSVDFWSLGMLGFKLLSGLPRKGSRCSEEILRKIPKGKKRGSFPVFRQFERDFIDIPSYLSQNARKIIEELMQVDPVRRLGNGLFKFKEIQRHPFFQGINWRKPEEMAISNY
ncbi:protein kinase C iota type-like [Centruroides sculpturatus]|uniref:protein kinase C iota type-like n=1 Tax=Centruroides sculpturatus TaxID=218467 RepID=UPI000C6DBE78|nr:protein kinase C iota type-like [Centruroides sculpturatus]